MRTRVVASVAVAAMVLLGTTACNFVSTQATLKHYDPSDGVSAHVGDVKVLNTLIISEDGEEGRLVASVVNTSDERVQLRLQYEIGSKDVNATITVAANDAADIVTEDGMGPVIENLDTKPGELFPLFVQYGDFTGQQMLVPVLDGSLPEYEDLLP